MITCPICKKEYIQLNGHHLHKHGITKEEFKKRYPDVYLGNVNGIKTNRERWVIKKQQDNIRCKVCGKLIISNNRKRRKFCSQTCGAIYNNQQREKDKKHICLYCKTIFYSYSKKAKFCSSKCSSEYRVKKLIKVICNSCKQEFEMREYRLKNSIYHFCGVKCRNEFFRLNPILRGTFSGYNGKSQLAIYRKLAFSNFEHKCVNCGYNKHDSLLQVHHKDFNHKNNILTNLELVCPTCHGEKHLGLR